MHTDGLVFAAETEGAETEQVLPPWRILVVDDDSDVHRLTRLTLDTFRHRNRGLDILSARTAAEARDTLAAHPDIAVILLDVVMETDDAGLVLARWVREQADNRAVRIILRTGVPGRAPEHAVIAEYDINDYLEKAEITVQRLYTSITTALRSYEDIRAVERARSGLQEVIAHTAPLHHLRSVAALGSAAVAAFVRHLDQDVRPALYLGAPDRLRVLAGVPDGPAEDLARAAASIGGSVFEADRVALHAAVPDGPVLVLAAGLECPLSHIDREILEVFASQLGSAFAIVQLTEHLEQRVAERTRDLEAANARLREMAYTDFLTAALSRRRLMDTAGAEVERVRRYGGALSVILFDLDHFKDLNDAYGHIAGDAVLCSVVRRCFGELREVDSLGRYGGEEFAILLPETPLAAAAEVAERLRRVIAERPVPVDGRAIAVSISAGLSAYRPEETNIQGALRRADSALYAAKRAGRNRVEVG